MAKTLLLADDSVTIQKVVGISFAGEDVDLITVDNGDDAITRAREARPDVILSDVVMPGKNGYEVCEAIKSDPALAHIPVLLLTGTFEAFDEERAARCGAAGHVAKPFEAQTLVARVAELLANPAPAASAAPPQSAVLGQTPITRQAPPAAPAERESINDQSFDFFDDELAAPPPPAAANHAAPVDLDPTDSTFAFGDDDIGGPGPADDRTVAMMPDGIEAPPAAAPLAPPAAAPPAPPAAAPPAPPMAAPQAPPMDAPQAPPMAAPREDVLAARAPVRPEEDLLPPPIEAPGAAGGGFDFENSTSFGEGDLLAPLTDDELAQETILDPKGASGYDVSSSDLRGSSLPGAGNASPAAAAPPPSQDEATVMVSPEPPARPAPDPALVGADLFADDMPLGDEPMVDPGRETVLASPDPEPMPLDDSSLDAMVPAAPAAARAAELPPMPAAEPAPEPVAVPEPVAAPEPPPAPIADFPPMPAAGPAPVPSAAPEAFASPEPDVLATPEPTPAPLAFAAPEPEPPAAPEPMPATEPFAMPEPSPEPLAMPMPESAPAPERSVVPVVEDPAAMASLALAEIEPRLREQLHDTLEKIAWESFGDVAEQIIRQALERVERVAWEVIPQMAETMIREEIRKLKGEG